MRAARIAAVSLVVALVAPATAFASSPSKATPAPPARTYVVRSGDNLAFNNVRFATFLVTGPRKVLTIADNPADAAIWKLALRVGELAGETLHALLHERQVRRAIANRRDDDRSSRADGAGAFQAS